MPAFLKIKSLSTYYNELAQPCGSLLQAKNINVDRNDMARPRRGLNDYGAAYPCSGDRGKQLIAYKDRLIRHYDSKLQYECCNRTGATWSAFSGCYCETEPCLRIKYAESNGNLYFTTSDGIRKLSGTINCCCVTNFSSATIINAGGPKALDLSAKIKPTIGGFLCCQSQTAYRIVWGYRDNNCNVIIGTPSGRSVVKNPTGCAADVVLCFTVPDDITNNCYFYQIYRTGLTSTSPCVDPGEEMNLIIESFVTTCQRTAGLVTETDCNPDCFREAGAILYTNPDTGEGIAQSNDKPPFAKDIALFNGRVWYANTRTLHRKNITLLSVCCFVSGTSKFYTGIGCTSRTYTFRGVKEVTCVTAIVKACIPCGSYFKITSASDERRYVMAFKKSCCYSAPSVVCHVTVTVDLTPACSCTACQVASRLKTSFDCCTNCDFTTSAVCAAKITITAAKNGNATDASDGCVATGFTIVVATQGDGECSCTNDVLLSSLASPGQAIDETARSLVKIINQDDCGLVNAFYLSGEDDLPGLILLEGKNLSDSQVWISSTNDIKQKFNPALPGISGCCVVLKTELSSNEKNQNRLYWSKFGKPEAVPALNYIDIGGKDKAIHRILALRENLFALKEDGAYIITGNSEPFGARLIDNSAQIIAPDSAAVLNNRIYALTKQGVTTIACTGASVISNQIEDKINAFTGNSFSQKKTFGVGYETDRAYLLFAQTISSDSNATQVYRYYTFNGSWTQWTLNATSGVVNPVDDKLYINSGNREYVQKERKALTRLDYADHEVGICILEQDIACGIFEVSSVSGVAKGDAVVQTQGVTIAKFNRLLKKLDADTLLTDSDYESGTPCCASWCGAVSAGVCIGQALCELIVKVCVDDKSTLTIASCAICVCCNTFTSASHGLTCGMRVVITSACCSPVTCPANLLDCNDVGYIICASTCTFKLSTTKGGCAINITCAGAGNHTIVTKYTAPTLTNFATIKSSWNTFVCELNTSSGTAYSNYPCISKCTCFEVVITNVNTSTNKITGSYPMPFIKGTATAYKGYEKIIEWKPQEFGDASMLKQISEGTILFDGNNFYSGCLAYASDLSKSFDKQEFYGLGAGYFGSPEFGTTPFGGEGNDVPFRKLLPRQKQRARYISPKFTHINAREEFKIIGMSLKVRPLSENAYRSI